MIIPESEKFKEVIDVADIAARTSVTILLTGEEGVSRETLARYIHDKSNYHDGPFVVVNVAERPSSLVDAELLWLHKRCVLRGEQLRSRTLAIGAGQ